MTRTVALSRFRDGVHIPITVQVDTIPDGVMLTFRQGGPEEEDGPQQDTVYMMLPTFRDIERFLREVEDDARSAGVVPVGG